MPRFLTAMILVLATATASFGQGIIAPTAGPINSSMAGASVAAPVDFGGSYWNPAILSGLPRNEFLLGTQLLIPSMHLTSGLPAGAINGVFPPTTRYGVSRSDSGVASNLATGVSFRLSDDSPTTFGIGVFGLVGGGVNYAGSYTTPILTPRQAPNYFGVGPDLRQHVVPRDQCSTASQQVTDRLAIGGGPDGPDRPGGLRPGLLRSRTQGRDRTAHVPRRDQRPAVLGSGLPDRPALQPQRQLEPGLLVQEPDLAGAVRVQLRRIPTSPRGGSASRRRCPRSSPGASPTRASSGP